MAAKRASLTAVTPPAKKAKVTEGAWFVKSWLQGHDWEKREDGTEEAGPFSTRSQAVWAALSHWSEADWEKRRWPRVLPP